jgi:hypothetical protein
MKYSNYCLLLLASLLLALPYQAGAQLNVKENTHELTRQARKGTLAKVLYEEKDQTTTLVYITQATRKRVKGELYVFDRDFKFVRQDAFEEARENYRKRFKMQIRLPKWQLQYAEQEEFTIDGVEVLENLMGALVLVKARYYYTYDPYTDRFTLTKSENLEKLKPRTESKEKYMPLYSANNFETGEVLILCQKLATLKTYKELPAQEAEARVLEAQQNLYLVVYDRDLNLVRETRIPVEMHGQLMFHQAIPAQGVAISGLSIRPRHAGGVAQTKGEGSSVLLNAVRNKFVPDFAIPAKTDLDGNQVDIDEADLMLITGAPADGQAPKLGKPANLKYKFTRLNNKGELVAQIDLPGFSFQ